MKHLHLRVPTVEDWQKFFDPNISGGGIFCPTNDPPEIGSSVQVEVLFVNGPRFFVRGLVTWRRTQPGDQRARPGAGIQILPNERTKISYINAWARGGVIDKREVRRLPVRLRIIYTARSARRITFTRDISEDGIFLASQELLEIHTTIRIMLVPPSDTRPFELLGEVVRAVNDGQERGMAVVLKFPNENVRERYHHFIVDLERKYLAGQLSDEVIG